MRRTLFVTLLLAAGTVIAEQPPPPVSRSGFTWDIGAGLASVSFPAYRGSRVRETLALPIPTFSITSERLNLGRDGARLSLLDWDRLSFRLSASGSLPVDSDDIPLREDMPDLHPSVELGPAATIRLPCWTGWACLQETLVRGVVASDFESIDTIGWTLQPRLTLARTAPQHKLNRHDWDITIGPVYATRLYHDYFYSVEARHATATRPAYQARSGFSGWRFSLTHVYQRRRLGIYSYVSYDNLRDTAFADSPLLETKDYVLAGLMLRWTLWGSDLPD